MNRTYTVTVKHIPSGRTLRLLVLSTNPAQAILACNRALNPEQRRMSECDFIAFGAEAA